MGHKICPYQLDGREITQPNHVLAADITHIPMARGFAYLVGIIDVYSRHLLAWRLSNSNGYPLLPRGGERGAGALRATRDLKTDQGSQSTSQAFTSVLEAHGLSISMDGKGSWRDNVFVERFWWSVKYEHVHLHAHDDPRAAREGIGRTSSTATPNGSI